MMAADNDLKLEIENNLRVANDLANSAEVNKEYINLLSGK